MTSSDVNLGIDGLADFEVIGRGGFSTVYAATDTRFDRRVAVKVLGEVTREADRARFDRECRVMGRLSSHPNVMTLYDAGFTPDDRPYLIMELTDGGSLADRMKARGLIAWKEAVGYLVPIAEALHHCHAEGILHRDVKPENILLTGDRPRLTDFGIAYLRDATGSASTSITASWLHTAPETFDNQRDERADIYSAASTLYALIAGRAPFEEPGDESLNPLMKRLLNDDPPPLPPGLAPPKLDGYIAQCLAKDPDDRPATAEQFANDLATIQASGGAAGPAAPGSTTRPFTGPGPGPGPGQGRAPGAVGPAGSGPGLASAPLPSPPVSAQPGRHFTPPTPAPAHLAGPSSLGPSPHPVPVPSGPPGPPPARQAPSNLQRRSSSTGAILSVVGIGAVAVVALLALAGLVLVARGESEVVGGENPVEPTVTEATRVDAEADLVDARSDDAEAGTGGSTDAEADLVDEGASAPPEPGPDVMPPTFTGEATTLTELEDRWAESRAAVVDALSSDAYGVGADNIVRGPGGFTVDLSGCPADWSDTGGVDDGTIRIGHINSLTGTSNNFGALADGMGAYIDLVNATGGVGGRQVELIVRDDQNNPDTGIQVANDLTAGNGVLAVNTMGTATSIATYDSLNATCVPQPMVVSAHPAFGDPVGHPFTTGLMMSWGSESVLWGEWIRANVATGGPVTVGALVLDTEFGKAYESTFAAWAAANPDVVADFVAVPHNFDDTNLTDEAAELAAADPDVFIAMTVGAGCPAAVQAANGAGISTSVEASFIPSVCRQADAYSVIGTDSITGYRTLGGGLKPVDDPDLAGDPYLAFMADELRSAGLEPTDPLHTNGFGFHGWALVEALRISAELPGGVSRTNLVLALRGMHLVHPMLRDGIALVGRGADDPFLVEGSEVSLYQSGDWVIEGVIDADGNTPACSWSFSGC